MTATKPSRPPGRPPTRKRRAHRHEYRVVWRHKGDTYERRYKAEQPQAVLRRLYRVGTETPWLGVTKGFIRRIWWQLAKIMRVPIETVADVPPQECLLRIQEFYRELDFIRVEWRQVGEWVEMIDPVENLERITRGKQRDRAERVMQEIAELAAGDPGMWDAWRHVKRGEADVDNLGRPPRREPRTHPTPKTARSAGGGSEA